MKYNPDIRKSLCLHSEFLFDVLLPRRNFRRDFLEGLNETTCRADIPEPEIRFHVNYFEEVNLLEEKLKNKCVHFRRVLWKHCPCSRKVSRRSIPDLLSMTVPPHKVYAFLRAVSLDLLLPRMVGGRENMQKIILSLRYLIGLSARGVFRVKRVVSKLQAPNLAMELYLTAFVRAYLMLMMRFLSHYFYVTELQPGTVAFFRNLIWREVQRKAVEKLQRGGLLRLMPPSRLRAAVRQSSCPGIGRLRFALKSRRRLRPLLVLSRPAVIGGQKLPAVNVRLQPLLRLFREIKQKCGIVKCARSASIEELFVKLDYYRNRKQKEGITQFFLVKCDVRDFYCHMNAEILLQELDRMFHSVAKYYPEWSWPDANEKKQLLENFLSHQYAKVGSSFFRLLRGIPQGASVAPYLGNLYLRRLDRQFRCQDADDMLLRLMDDFLFISPSQQRAEEFLILVTSALSKLHLQLNEDKVQLSYRSEKITFLGFELLANLEVVITPKEEITKMCRFAGDQLEANAVLRRIARFVPNLRFFNFGVKFAGSEERTQKNREELARALAQHVRALLKSSPDRQQLLTQHVRQLAAAINWRLSLIGEADLSSRRNCRAALLKVLAPFRGQFARLLRQLAAARSEKQILVLGGAE